MKNILNVIADVLTLTAVCVAAIGHVLPWYHLSWVNANPAVIQEIQEVKAKLSDLQRVQAPNSGMALGVLAGLICLSLLIRWGPGMRRLLNLAMFASAFAALLFELVIFADSTSVNQDLRWNVNQADFHLVYINYDGFYLAMIPTCVAVFLCLVRMLWTMPPSRPITPAALDVKPAVVFPAKESSFTERKI